MQQVTVHNRNNSHSPPFNLLGTGTDGTFGPKQVIVSSSVKNYTAYDIAEIIDAEGLDNMLQIYKEVSPLLIGEGFAAPGVDTYIVYGFNVTTHCGLLYDKPFEKGVEPPAPYDLYYRCNDDGDGTVNLNSLQRAGLTWASDARQHGFVLNVTRFIHMEHMAAVHDTRVLDFLSALIGV